jgi:hypothetical protein
MLRIAHIIAAVILAANSHLAFADCSHEALPEPNLPHTSKEWGIWAYSSAAPSFLAQNATVLDAKGGILRAGDNGWTCMPGNPRGMSDPENGWKNAHEAMPVCADAAAMAWMDAWIKGEKPNLERDGFMWMLHGDMGEDNTKPMVLNKSDAADPSQWIESGPHMMLMPKNVASLAAFTEDFTRGEPYVMMPGSDYAHLMIPVEGYYRYQPESSPLHSPQRGAASK